jgi:hypothetical protein
MGNPVARRERYDLLASADEERVAADNERVNLTESCEDVVDLAFCTGLKDLEPQTLRCRRLPRRCNVGLDSRVLRVH